MEPRSGMLATALVVVVAVALPALGDAAWTAPVARAQSVAGTPPAGNQGTGQVANVAAIAGAAGGLALGALAGVAILRRRGQSAHPQPDRRPQPGRRRAPKGRGPRRG